ncbi:MAG TPA: LysM peptidoglycan-binding domain-containing protein [Gaiellaceae bacterium]|nr:LysM peptidoglycan-binding domain-containing protein [Gaiellaceae bacterium]
MFARVFPRIVFVLLAAALLWAVFARDTGAGAHARVHTVRSGDTLWAIAVASYPGDPREGVWRLQQRNGLSDATLVPGQRLVVP